MTLKTRYKETIRPKLLKELGLKNIHQVPKVLKVNVNRGLGEAASNTKALEASLNEMATITGQKALVTRAKKAIATFKIRQGMPIGCSVTLRGDRMYAFLERFINLALPRIRDFRGVSPKSFDGRGNYTIGVKEQLIFPEISSTAPTIAFKQSFTFSFILVLFNSFISKSSIVSSFCCPLTGDRVGLKVHSLDITFLLALYTFSRFFNSFCPLEYRRLNTACFGIFGLFRFGIICNILYLI